MWIRRVLLATMVAAAAMSLPRQLPASFNAAVGPSNIATSSLR